jgi:MYXO-CTERM domain-containing protein
MARGTTSLPSPLLLSPALAAIVVFAAGPAEAATPTYYNSLAAFQLDITSTVTDDYQNPAYVFNQSNAVMSAVFGETDYMTTGFVDWNLVVGGGHYCAGCNGSFELQFQTTSVGNAIGVNGAGFDIASSDNTYFAYITFGDGTTDNIQLPPAGTFWGVAAPERIERIHIGLSNGASTTGGYFELDNLIVGDGAVGTCTVDADCFDDQDPCTEQVCSSGVCTYPFNVAPCDDDEVCTENDVCSLGVCQGSLVGCEDGNPCTTNYCDFGSGCALANNVDPCDDGDVCTEMDECAAGVCAGVPASCNDDDVCTADSCDPDVGCTSEPIAGCCVNDQDCGDGEICELGMCIGGSAESSSSEGGLGTGEPGDSGDTARPGDTGLDGTGDGNGDSGVVTGPGSDEGTTSGGSTGDTGVGFDDGTPPTPDFSVCNCTSDPAPQQRLWWLLAVLGVFVRRRRSVGTTGPSPRR